MARRGARDDRRQPAVEPGPLARRAGQRHRVDEAAGLRADPRQPLVGRGRRDERHEREPARVARRAASSAASSSGRSGTIRPLTPTLEQRVGEALETAGEDQVGVAHHARPGRARRSPARPRARRGRRPGAQRRGAGGVDHRAVGERVRERDAELDQVGAGVGVGEADPRARSRGPGSRPSGTASAPPGARWRGRTRTPPRSARSRSRRVISRASWSSASARSLSPRPDRQTRSSSLGPFGQRPGERVGALERRDDPLQPRGQCERVERLGVGDRDVAGAAAVAQPGVLGAAARVVEPGRDRVRLEDLAVLVLHDRREGAVQDAGRARRRSAARRGARSRSPRRRPRRRPARPRRRRRTG